MFNGDAYNLWKSRMKDFIKSVDYEVWKIVKDGPLKIEDEKKVKKPKATWNEEDTKRAEKNAKARNILKCVLTEDEFNQVSALKSAKEIWDSLKNKYEGNEEVKESKVDILVHQYELFTMNEEESITEMYARFSKIMNSLKGFGKNYSQEDKVKKILRVLPKAWRPKVTAIQECKNLKTLSIDTLIGSLLTYEVVLKEEEPSMSHR
ncbi:hypothetical protein Dimus_039143 [Dionaea muscipula]